VPSRIGKYLQRGAGLPDAAAWTTWLTTNLPLDLQNIELKYGSESMSQLLVVSMPIDIWSYLPKHLGYSVAKSEMTIYNRVEEDFHVTQGSFAWL